MGPLRYWILKSLFKALIIGKKCLAETLATNPTTIYLVDDDRIVCHSHMIILKKYGYQVEVYNSAEAFIKAHPKPTQGVLVVDHNMSGMTGLELQQKLKAENVIIPIIFITAMYGAVEETATRNGAVGVFEKPFDPKELVDLLDTIGNES